MQKKKVDHIEKSIFHLTPKSQKYEDAAELFVKAAKQLQLARASPLAGNAYLRASECYQRSEFSQNQVATCLINAAHNFIKENVPQAINCMLKGIALLTEDGKFNQAAKYEKELAEMYENVDDPDNAVKHYEIAGEYYDMEGSKTTGAECLGKIVPLYAAKGDYGKAAELLEKMADAQNGSLAKYSLKEHCLKAGILYLCIPDNVAAKKLIERCSSKFSDNFRGTREYTFIVQLVGAATNGDADGFKKVISEWESVSALDSFKRTYLDKAYDKIASEGSGSDDYT